MSFLLPSGSHQHEPLPSLPTTPTQMEEEDLGRASWLDDHHEEHHTERLMPQSTSTSSRSKGKGKAREVVRHEQDEDVDEGGSGSGSGSSGLNPVLEESADGVLEYPPTSEELSESKRIAENLRRMETADRLRRKAARESTSSVASSSIIGEVSRRASLLWRQGRNSSLGSNGGGSGNHKPLSMRNSEDNLPLDAMDRSPRTASSDTVFSPIRRSPSPADNPFDPPDTNAASAVMSPSSPPEQSDPASSPFADSASVPSKPALLAASSFAHDAPPIPQPLGLPPPKTPPPRVKTPGADFLKDQDADLSGKRHRWWTDWLCGCRESTEEDGDGQAGRTNPFE